MSTNNTLVATATEEPATPKVTFFSPEKVSGRVARFIGLGVVLGANENVATVTIWPVA